MALVDRLRNGDALHREAADALVAFGSFSEFVLSDDERSLAFVRAAAQRLFQERSPRNFPSERHV